MKKILLFFLALGLAWQLGAQPPFPPQGPPQGAPRQAPQQQTLIKAALPEYWANPTGKYAVAVDDQTLPEHTLFYPKDLASLKKNEKLPVFVMSGPGCDKTSSAFRAFFTEVASHGYMVIISGVLTEETVNTGILPKNTRDDLLTAMDWASAETVRPGSPFYGKIDADKVCAGGQSCGGFQALSIMTDPRIKLLNLFNSGLFAGNGRMSMGGASFESKEDAYKDLHVPIAYFVGDTDMARPNATDDFNYVGKNRAVLGVREIPGDAHAGTFREMNGGAFAPACVHWLDWNLKGIKKASKYFKGKKAVMANDPEWIVFETKNL